MPNPYSPNLPSEVLAAEAGWLQGAILGGITYGADIVLFLACFQFLFPQVRSLRRSLFGICLFGYTCLAFVCSTLSMGFQSKFTEMAFIDNRNYPGGPSAYETDMFSIPENAAGSVAFTVGNWLSGAMMLWRCLVIFQGWRPSSKVVLSGLGTIFLSVIAVGILFTRQNFTTSIFSPENTSTAINWTVPYFCLSLSLNLCTTLAIVVRLLTYRYRINQVLGLDHMGSFTTMAAIFIESSALYSTFALLFLIFFAARHPVSTVFMQSLSQVQTAASLLVVFRVAKGRAWSITTTPGTTAGSERQLTTIPLSVVPCGLAGDEPVSSTTGRSRGSSWPGMEQLEVAGGSMRKTEPV